LELGYFADLIPRTYPSGLREQGFELALEDDKATILNLSSKRKYELDQEG
jgi:hypothetical protein